jgi:acetolactate decarboxylase
MKQFKILLVGLCLLLLGCSAPRPDTVFQLSTIDALLAGVYEGDQTCGSLLNHGDQGIGTFNDLDGEMIVLNGTVYQIKSDGKVYQPATSTKTPFASVCSFKPELEFPIPGGLDFPRVQELLNEKASNQNLICSFKITGKFKMMHTRSVPRQSKPFPPLSEVTAHQPEFNMENISGTIIGFRFPAFIKGINMPGYHLHFISNDQSCGGHILGFEVIEGRCLVDIIHQFELKLPAESSAFGATDLTKDRSMELKKVEGGN